MEMNKALKTLLNVLALSAVAAAAFSCTVRQLDEDLQPAPSGERVEFTASIEDEALTRSSVDAGLNFYWSPGDQVNLFYGPGGNTPGSLFTSQNTETTQSTTFTGTISAFTGSGNDGEMLSFWGVSPYQASNRSDGSSVQVTLSTVQQAVAENFASNTMLMVAKSPGLALSFKHVGAMLHIRMSRSDIVSVTFRGNAGETVAGRVSVTMDSSGKPVWSPINGQGSKYVMLKKPDGFVAGTYYYLYFLPQTFAHGWSLTFTTSDGKTGTYTSNSSITFQRAASRNVNGLDARVTTWEDTVEYIEMGPGIFWATKNVGADSPEEYGDYFAWGETTPKTSFSWDNYKYGSSATSLTKYTYFDAATQLDASDDAATVNLGEHWATPTDEEWDWLLQHCTWTWGELNGKNGCFVTSNVSGYEGNRIFLPAAGYDGGVASGSYGYYWASALDGSNYGKAREVVLSPSSHFLSSDERRYGSSVRPVYHQSILNGHDFVELGVTSANGKVLKWATINIGAMTQQENGEFFAWGETEPYYSHPFQWKPGKSDGYVWGSYFDTDDNGSTFKKYAANKKKVLDPEDDAAHVNWGGTWRMPTSDEWEALFNEDNFDIAWVSSYGGSSAIGLVVTSKMAGYEGNNIFLRALGYRLDTSVVSIYVDAYYWSSSLGLSYYNQYISNSAQSFSAPYDYSPSIYSASRYFGLPVRAVSE